MTKKQRQSSRKLMQSRHQHRYIRHTSTLQFISRRDRLSRVNWVALIGALLGRTGARG